MLLGGDAGTRSGDHRARFAAVVRDYGPALDRLAAGYERVPERRRDLVQEVLAAVWRALPSFEERASLRTWVYRVAHNTASTFVLRETRSRTSAWRPIHEVEAATPLASDEDLEAGVARARSVERLASLVRALPPLDRQIVLLFLEGLSSAEIAEVTGLSVTNVTTKLSRLRASLRAELQGGEP